MRYLFSAIAIALFVVAWYFGSLQPFCQLNSGGAIADKQVMQPQVAVAPNMLAGLATLGFAIAGGLSLIAAALVKDKG